MSKYENNKGRFQKGHKYYAYWTGKKHTQETIAKIKEGNRKNSFWRGKKLPEEAKEKQRLAKLGENHWNWKGGITKLENRIRKTAEYALWRIAVFTRDNFTCVWCGSKKNIEADHIKPFAYFPELRFDVNNGRTLCRECHKSTETFGGRCRK